MLTSLTIMTLVLRFKKRITEAIRPVMHRIDDRLWPAWNHVRCEIVYSPTAWRLAIAYEDTKRITFKILVAVLKPVGKGLLAAILTGIRLWKESKESRMRMRRELTVWAAWLRYRFAEGPLNFAEKSSSGIARAIILFVCGLLSIYLAEQYLPLWVKAPLVFAAIPMLPRAMAMLLGSTMGLLDKNYTLADALLPIAIVLATLTTISIGVSFWVTAIWSKPTMIVGGGSILILLLATYTQYHWRFTPKRRVTV